MDKRKRRDANEKASRAKFFLIQSLRLDSLVLRKEKKNLFQVETDTRRLLQVVPSFSFSPQASS